MEKTKKDIKELLVELLKLVNESIGLVVFLIILGIVLYRFFEYREQPSNIVVLTLILLSIKLNANCSN